MTLGRDIPRYAIQKRCITSTCTYISGKHVSQPRIKIIHKHCISWFLYFKPFCYEGEPLVYTIVNSVYAVV